MCHRVIPGIILALFIVDLHAAEVTVEAGYAGKVAIKLDGWITSGDARKIARVRGDSEVAWLELDSTGGDVETGLDIARYVSKTSVPVLVTDECYSACAYAAFVAIGRNRLLVGDDAVLGIHQTYDTGSGDPSPAWDREVVRRLKRYGAPLWPLRDMLNTTFDSMRTYGHDELVKRGAVPWVR